MLLRGRRLLVTGVVTRRSIAFAVAREAQEAGAEVVLTSFGRVRSLTERAARNLPEPVDVLELDVNVPEQATEVARALDERWGGVDGVLHAVAHAPPDAIGGHFLQTPWESAAVALQTSAYSLKTLATELAPLLQRSPGGGSVVALDFDATVAWPQYDWMGVAKAALESIGRYLARELGPRGIRVNLVAAGPLRTEAATRIAEFERLAGGWSHAAPLGWDPRDPRPVARAVCWLLSEWSQQITGEIVHVDGGRHAVGMPIDDEPTPLSELPDSAVGAVEGNGGRAAAPDRAPAG